MEDKLVPVVIAEALGRDPAALQEQMDRAIRTLPLARDFGRARAVFIKPNLTYPFHKNGVTTQAAFVGRLVAGLRKINTTTRIIIGEGEGGYNSFSMTSAMRHMGFFEFESLFPNVTVVNLSGLPARPVELRAKNRPYALLLPEFLLDEIDFSISCPLPKVHGMTLLSLSFKNQWGCLPDAMRLKNHYVFDEIIAQVCEKLKFRYAFLDGRFGLDLDGPMVGRAVETDWFVASNSLGAFDLVVSEMMGFDWRSVCHLHKAWEGGHVPEKSRIRIEGDIPGLKRPFVLQRSFWHYPALAAFRSRRLTHLFYFSKVSRFLHTVMYLFRKKPIDGLGPTDF